MLSRLLVALTSLVLAAASPAAAQFPFDDPQQASAEAFTRVVSGRVQVAIDVEIDDHWHLYHFHKGNPDGIGTELTIDLEAPGVRFGEVRAPEPVRYEQPGLGPKGSDVWILGHEGTIRVWSIGELEGGVTTVAPEDVEVALKGLTCEDGGSCIPYSETVTAKAGDDAVFADFPSDLSLEFEGPAPYVGADGEVTERSAEPEPAGHAARLTDEEYAAWESPAWTVREGVDGAPAGGADKSLLVYLLLAFVAGMILNVMPCVLPVISIKVLSFVQQAGEDKRRVFQLGLAFAAGILIVFLGLAVFAITASAGWGEQFQSPTFLIVMIGIVFAFSLSMFGVYEIGVPTQVGAMASGNREGMGDAFFKGMLATLLATPCSGPFLGSTLAWALAQSPLTIFLIFTSLGLGMALPYVFLTANPKLLKMLPKPGPWMETFKQAMGFVLVGTVLFLMISLDPDLLLLTLVFLLFVGLGCWWYGRMATFQKPRAVRYAHLAAAFLIAGVGARLSFVDMSGFLNREVGEGWVHFEPDAFKQHLADGRSVFVDFTASWCLNCKTNKVVVYDSESVQEAFRRKGVVVMEADETGDTPYTAMLKRFRQSLGSNSIPFMAVFPADSPYEPIVARDIVTRGQMLEILESLPDPSNGGEVLTSKAEG